MKKILLTLLLALLPGAVFAQGTFQTALVTQTLTLPSGATITNSSGDTATTGSWKFTGIQVGSVYFTTGGSTITVSGGNPTWTATGATITFDATGVLFNTSLINVNGSSVTIANGQANGSIVISSNGSGTATVNSTSGLVNLSGHPTSVPVAAGVTVSGSISPGLNWWVPLSSNLGNSNEPWDELHVGHVVSEVVGSAPPTVTVQAGAGGGGSASISGTDAAGQVTVNTTTGAINYLAFVTFGHVYASAPSVIVVPANGAAQGGPFPVAYPVGTNGFYISTATAAWPSSATLLYTYHVIQ